MPAGNRGPRSYRALLALAAVGCEGVNQGPLEPADSAGPTYDDVLGACTS
jgi:hypothetical protein